MRRTASIAFALGILAVGCGGNSPAPSPSPSAPTTATSAPTTATPSETPTPVTTSLGVSPTPPPQIQLPADAPRKFTDSVPIDEVPLTDIVPPGAKLVDSSAARPSSNAGALIEFTWTRGSDPFAAEHGFEIWQRFADQPAWRVVYAFTDASDSGVLGVRWEDGDLTGDGVEDVLSFEDTGGSGACGVWRVIEVGVGFAAEIYDRTTCDTQIEVGAGTLRVTEAVFLPGDAHCCPSKTRHTTLRWDGEAWQVIAREVTPND